MCPKTGCRQNTGRGIGTAHMQYADKQRIANVGCRHGCKNGVFLGVGRYMF